MIRVPRNVDAESAEAFKVAAEVELSSAPPTGSAAELEIARARFNRTVEVEQYLLDAAAGKKPLPDAVKCLELARKIGVPPNAAAKPPGGSEVGS